MPEITGDRMDGQTEDFLGLEDLDGENRTFQAGHRGTLIFGAKPDNTDNPNLEQGKRVNFRVVNDDDGGGVLELTFPDSEDVDEKGKPPGVSIKFSDCKERLNPALRFFLDIKNDEEKTGPKDLVEFILIPKDDKSIVDRFRLDPVGGSTVSIASEYDLFDSLSLPDSTEVQTPKTPSEILKQVSHRDYLLEDHKKFSEKTKHDLKIELETQRDKEERVINNLKAYCENYQYDVLNHMYFMKEYRGHGYSYKIVENFPTIVKYIGTDKTIEQTKNNNPITN